MNYHKISQINAKREITGTNTRKKITRYDIFPHVNNNKPWRRVSIITLKVLARVSTFPCFWTTIGLFFRLSVQRWPLADAITDLREPVSGITSRKVAEKIEIPAGEQAHSNTNPKELKKELRKRNTSISFGSSVLRKSLFSFFVLSSLCCSWSLQPRYYEQRATGVLRCRWSVQVSEPSESERFVCEVKLQ